MNTQVSLSWQDFAENACLNLKTSKNCAVEITEVLQEKGEYPSLRSRILPVPRPEHSRFLGFHFYNERTLVDASCTAETLSLEAEELGTTPLQVQDKRYVSD